MEIYQLSDEMMILKHRTYYGQGIFNIYIISIKSGIIQRILNDIIKTKFNYILPVFSKQFMTISCAGDRYWENQSCFMDIRLKVRLGV